MIEVSLLSTRFTIRHLSDEDSESILALYRENTQFYQFCEEKPTREQVLSDLRVAPPGISPSEKHYIGYHQKGLLIAVMDLIDGYPKPDSAFIGLFMVRKALQGQGLGSSLIQETAAYLKDTGKTAIRLAINKGNPQATSFWKKNGFHIIKEVDRRGWPILVAERRL